VPPTAISRWTSLLVAAAGVACGQRVASPRLFEGRPPNTARPSETLKAHMRAGDLYILSSWTSPAEARSLQGRGQHYDVARRMLDSGEFTLPVDSVALFEANDQKTIYPFAAQGVAVLTTLGAAVSAACLADPKSCFGSCPTFYVDGPDSAVVQAEGFSSSVARALEARDVDALVLGARGGTVSLRMRNEAWETQAVRRVALLVVPKPFGGRVLAVGDSLYFPATDFVAANECRGSGGSCAKPLAALDALEWTSRTDSSDLATREELELVFPRVPAHPAIALRARNSLVSTFVFYQTLAFFGSDVGDYLATMERAGSAFARSAFGMADMLGGIDVQLRRPDGSWYDAGSFHEAGPIAGDVKAIPLPLEPSDHSVHVRLRLAKGNWRIDWAALASLGDPVVPDRVAPERVERGGEPDERALATLRGGTRHLVALPGDEYRLSFVLPRAADQLELFLESEGYYYEWMRREWLVERDPELAMLAVMNPAAALRRLAPAFKQRESQMDELFWRSRFTLRNGHASTH
jgi:hypothetical protein